MGGHPLKFEVLETCLLLTSAKLSAPHPKRVRAMSEPNPSHIPSEVVGVVDRVSARRELNVIAGSKFATGHPNL